jgi:hypothetical protein
LTRNAFVVSWLPQEARAGYLDELDKYVAAPA